MNSKTRHWAGWGLSILISLLLIGPSAMGKFLDWEGKEEAFAKMGITIELMRNIGIVEVIIAILFLIPKTAFIGAILITGYLGGAILTHLRIGDPIVMPIVIGVLVWIGLGLRQPEIFRLAFGINVSPANSTSPHSN
jgi:hypothetical protein